MSEIKNGVLEGEIIWFDPGKGYGWIKTEKHGDFYVHNSGIILDGSPTLKTGELVNFTLISGPKGPRAINVTRRLPEWLKGAEKNGNERV